MSLNNNISCISMFIKMVLKKYDMIDYHDGCGRGDKASARNPWLAEARNPYGRDVVTRGPCASYPCASFLGRREYVYDCSLKNYEMID